MDYQAKKNALTQVLKNGAGQVSLYKDTSNLFRSVDRRSKEGRLDVRSFKDIIAIDKDNLTASVEGMATYDDVVRETLRHSLLPAVVPQLKSITVGGAYAGGGIESSSFKYGLVHETVTSADVLLGDGSVVPCAPENSYADLFHAFPNTYGSLGYALKVDLRIVPAKPYVKVSYTRYSDPIKYFADLSARCEEGRAGNAPAFLDGVIFSSSEMYTASGEFVDSAPYLSDYKGMNIYYRSIQQRREDYLSTADYIWRWDADWFWCSKVFMMQNPVMRALFGRWMLSSTVYAKIMHSIDKHAWMKKATSLLRGQREAVIQDILIPSDSAADFFSFYCEEVGIFPVWICPAYALPRSKPFDFFPLTPGATYFDFGFWDSVPTTKPDGYINRQIERKCQDLKGMKSLYSTSFYTEDEFWQLYDRGLYSKVKDKYDPAGRLKGLYEKVC